MLAATLFDCRRSRHVHGLIADYEDVRLVAPVGDHPPGAEFPHATLDFSLGKLHLVRADGAREEYKIALIGAGRLR